MLIIISCILCNAKSLLHVHMKTEILITTKYLFSARCLRTVPLNGTSLSLL